MGKLSHLSKLRELGRRSERLKPDQTYRWGGKRRSTCPALSPLVFFMLECRPWFARSSDFKTLYWPNKTCLYPQPASVLHVFCDVATQNVVQHQQHHHMGACSCRSPGSTPDLLSQDLHVNWSIFNERCFLYP